MNRRILIGQRLVAVFAFGVLLLIYPILSLFNRAQTIFGIPALYVYIFLAWIVLIGLFVIIIERGK